MMDSPNIDVILNTLNFKSIKYKKGDVLYDNKEKAFDGIYYLQKGMLHYVNRHVNKLNPSNSILEHSDID